MALSKALGTDLSALAQIIKSKGRGKDTVLAHITPQEAALLKARGGRGSTNPDTGLPEFDDDSVDIGVSEAQQNAPLPSGNEAIPEAGLAASAYPTGLATGQGTPYQAQGLVDTGKTPSGLGDYSLASGVPAVGLGQTGIGGGTGQGLYDTGVSPIYTGAAQTGGELSSLAYDPTLGKTSKEALLEAQTSPATKPEQAGFLDKALAGLGKTDTLGRLGLTGALGAYGAMQGKQAATQNAEATSQKSAIAAPYQQQGQQLIGAAQRGELTPANQQVIQQQRARLAQASSNMGGVGQQQIENQISSLTSQLIQNQYQYGLQVMQIGDNIELGAINTQLQLDQQLTQANKSFYTSLAQLAAGSPMYVPGLTSVTPTRT